MIITDILQIDSLAEQLFGAPTDLVSVDMDDYSRLKENVTSLRATRVELPSLEPTAVDELVERLRCFDPQGVERVLVNVSAVSAETITMTQMRVFLDAVSACLGNPEVIWGVTEREQIEGCVVGVIVGYGK